MSAKDFPFAQNDTIKLSMNLKAADKFDGEHMCNDFSVETGEGKVMFLWNNEENKFKRRRTNLETQNNTALEAQNNPEVKAPVVTPNKTPSENGGEEQGSSVSVVKRLDMQQTQD